MTHASTRFNGSARAYASVISKVSGAESPWERVPMDVPVTAFGPGSAAPFARYFEDESRVQVASVDDIVAWLARCEYMSDADQFHERDVWQQPSSFERRQRGDCEDFALWAWRKLAEIGVDAEFFVGRVTGGGDPAVQRQHAWIVFRVDGDECSSNRPRATGSGCFSRFRRSRTPTCRTSPSTATSSPARFVGCLLTL
jgi:hypothetical protein